MTDTANTSDNDSEPGAGRLRAVSEFWELPGDPAFCPDLRGRIRRSLTGFPHAAADAELVVAELFANACRHSLSGDGGKVTVTLAGLRTGLVLVTVTDQGPRPDPATGRPASQTRPLDGTLATGDADCGSSPRSPPTGDTGAPTPADTPCGLSSTPVADPPVPPSPLIPTPRPRARFCPPHPATPTLPWRPPPWPARHVRQLKEKGVPVHTHREHRGSTPGTTPALGTPEPRPCPAETRAGFRTSPIAA